MRLDRCRRCRRKPVHLPDCTNNGGGLFRSHCLACARIVHAERHYIPFDELIAEPVVRVLRLLARFEHEVDQRDIREMLELPNRYHSAEERRINDAHNTAVRRLLVAGHIARREWRELDTYYAMRTRRSYVITAAGRQELGRRMKHAQLDAIATDAELAEVHDEPIDRRRRARRAA